MNNLDLEVLKDEFYYSLCQVFNNQKKAKDFMNYLENETDYFTAPASHRYHSSCENGLLNHSYLVFLKLKELNELHHLNFSNLDCFVVGMFHDFCKTNFYKVDYKNIKDDKGNWVKAPYYTIEDANPLGVHGDKSVMLLLLLEFPLTEKQAYCIRYHMGAFEGQQCFNSLNAAVRKYPEILYVQLADQLATIEEEANN